MTPSRQAGTGMISSVAAISVFLAFLLFAVQLLYGLYATSVVTAEGYDAARDVAATAGRSEGASLAGPMRDAERAMRARLGRFCRDVSFDWKGSTSDAIRLHLEADTPQLAFAGSLGSRHIERTILVRVERYR